MMEKTLQELRSEIDLIDADIISAIAKRFAATREVGKLKARDALPAIDTNREAAQRLKHEELAEKSGLAVGMVIGIFHLVMREVVTEHERL